MPITLLGIGKLAAVSREPCTGNVFLAMRMGENYLQDEKISILFFLAKVFFIKFYLFFLFFAYLQTYIVSTCHSVFSLLLRYPSTTEGQHGAKRMFCSIRLL